MKEVYYKAASVYKSTSVFVMSLMYILIGIKHFTEPDFFLNIVPPKIPFKLFAVYFTGALEILGGALILSRKSRRIGAYVLICLLVVVFPANIYLYLFEAPQQLTGVNENQALIRMPFQIPLILLAYWHSSENHPKWFNLICLIAFIPTIAYFIFISA